MGHRLLPASRRTVHDQRAVQPQRAGRGPRVLRYGNLAAQSVQPWDRVHLRDLSAVRRQDRPVVHLLYRCQQHADSGPLALGARRYRYRDLRLVDRAHALEPLDWPARRPPDGLHGAQHRVRPLLHHRCLVLVLRHRRVRLHPGGVEPAALGLLRPGRDDGGAGGSLQAEPAGRVRLPAPARPGDDPALRLARIAAPLDPGSTRKTGRAPSR